MTPSRCRRWLFRVSSAIALLVLVLAASVSPAHACACGRMSPPAPDLTPEHEAAWQRESTRRMIASDLDRAIAVFSGEVIEHDIVRVRFARDRIWKGDLTESFYMQTGAVRNADGTVSATSCDFFFQKGGTYVVFAFGSSTETMRTGSCSYTSDLSHASLTLEMLDAIVDERSKAPTLRPVAPYDYHNLALSPADQTQIEALARTAGGSVWLLQQIRNTGADQKSIAVFLGPNARTAVWRGKALTVSMDSPPPGLPPSPWYVSSTSAYGYVLPPPSAKQPLQPESSWPILVENVEDAVIVELVEFIQSRPRIADTNERLDFGYPERITHDGREHTVTVGVTRNSGRSAALTRDAQGWRVTRMWIWGITPGIK